MSNRDGTDSESDSTTSEIDSDVSESSRTCETSETKGGPESESEVYESTLEETGSSSSGEERTSEAGNDFEMPSSSSGMPDLPLDTDNFIFEVGASEVGDDDDDPARQELLLCLACMEEFINRVSLNWETFFSRKVSPQELEILLAWLREEEISQTTGGFLWGDIEEECTDSLFQAVAEALNQTEIALGFLESQRLPASAIMEASEEIWNASYLSGESALRRQFGALGRRLFTFLEELDEETRRLGEFRDFFSDNPISEAYAVLRSESHEPTFGGIPLGEWNEASSDEELDYEEGRPFPNPWRAA